MTAFCALLPTHYSREKPLLCHCLYRQRYTHMSSNTSSALLKGNGNCYVLNLNVVPLLSVPAILFNISVSI